MNWKLKMPRIAVILLVGFICIGTAFYVLWIRPIHARIPFVQQVWLQEDLRTRGKMANDLIASNRLHGMTRAEVLALLGTSRSSSTDSLAYAVDIGMTFGSDSWTYELVIEFDKSDRVRNCYLHD